MLRWFSFLVVWMLFHNFLINKRRVMINWHHSLIRWHHFSNTLTSLFEYIDIILRIHWHPLVRSEKKVARSSAILHARCTRSAQITWVQTKLRSLLSWSSSFEICKNDSKRATFDVIIKSEIRAFLKLFQKFKVFDVSRRANAKKISKLKVSELLRSFTLSLLIFLAFALEEHQTFIKTSKKLLFRLDNHVKCRSFWVILAGFESAWSA
jgi:hypothetical protein